MRIKKKALPEKVKKIKEQQLEKLTQYQKRMLRLNGWLGFCGMILLQVSTPVSFDKVFEMGFLNDSSFTVFYVLNTVVVISFLAISILSFFQNHTFGIGFGFLLSIIALCLHFLPESEFNFEIELIIISYLLLHFHPRRYFCNATYLFYQQRNILIFSINFKKMQHFAQGLPDRVPGPVSVTRYNNRRYPSCLHLAWILYHKYSRGLQTQIINYI